ncbi:MAG: phospho-N-acetylmuramoyl-pentapeptide-transferase [Sulfuricurvum sp.]|uniref:phospho-N-acetylmuramoyl-pentapeptide- transferase n=1 Tax=Sulfuricurvum sp. TaxID=2025608 RepID=UPI00263011EE|nr:phospho-N-acetylmuramoyl-pentapeptide-transferase [Sulfuricurvum sp.]MDD2837871.1 phospho-N-acetylmuramoyl-pentapeptide-transferase [Sulfuricurvum sp.]MDD3595821.1 phospho-N-acetylmuramoyl-pentapeptide-transferase [Sulfuricurvum sp.]MDD4883829.1 phospho-N-acetylmuramoyl-pentapeptide-transferase [Sulfuricurvum sp.]
MLYWLHHVLGINLLQYITVRAGVAFFIGLLLTLFLMPRFIAWAQRSSRVQPINEYVAAHQGKAKTPTMGGIVFIVSTIIASLLTVNVMNPFVIGGLLTLVFYAYIGFTDDWGKIRGGDNLAGLSPRAKLMLQLVFGIAIGVFLIFVAKLETGFYVPFLKSSLFDMGWFSIGFWVLVIIATSNAVNLTDGLDGLATVPSIFALLSLSIIVYVVGNAALAHYLLMPKIPAGEVVIIASALIGSLIGFLWFNCHPAQVFMGDSGSLTLGAFIAYMAIIGKSEVLLILIGLIFVIETVSVILQVGSYKLRKKRVFLMAPIHHHFEMKQWAENKIIVRFWIIALLSNIVALITLKIR